MLVRGGKGLFGDLLFRGGGGGAGKLCNAERIEVKDILERKN